MVEGVRGIEDGFLSGTIPTLVLYNSRLLARTPRGMSLFTALNGAIPGHVFECSERALEAAAQTDHPQGIVAAFPMREWPPTLPDMTSPLFLVCDGISDPGNMGTLLRSAEAAGADAVFAVQGCVDIFNPKVVRAGMGAHFRLPIYQDLTWDDIGKRLAAHGLGQGRVFCTATGAALTYDEINWSAGSALIVSNEAHGISASAQALCETEGKAIGIPMHGGTESLNAAVAGSVILFEAARQRRSIGTGVDTK